MKAHWGEVFERNGTLTTTTMGHRSVGKWRLQKDQLCIEHGKESGGGCYAYGFREKTWSSETRPRVCLWKACCRSPRTAADGEFGPPRP